MSTTKTFEIGVAEGRTAAEILERAQSAARGVGITITGDDSGGRFVGTAQGSYAVDLPSRIVRVEVSNKPSFVPWGVVEAALKKLFG